VLIRKAGLFRPAFFMRSKEKILSGQAHNRAAVRQAVKKGTKKRKYKKRNSCLFQTFPVSLDGGGSPLTIHIRMDDCYLAGLVVR